MKWGGLALWTAMHKGIFSRKGYPVSAELASVCGAFEKFAENKEPMLNVINMHRQRCKNISEVQCPDYMLSGAKDAWDQALDAGSRFGFRNAQVTVLAPTGTIGFMMDCDT